MIAALSGIRAIAITLVLLRHGIDGAIEKFDINNDSFLSIFMTNGWSGVDLFFVLSGFLIGYHLCNRWPKDPLLYNRFIKLYLYRRCIRILPVYYAAIGLAVLASTSIYTITSNNIIYDLAIHIVFLQDYLGAKFIVALWSLGSEIKFYILAPFLLYVLLKIKSKPLIYIFLATVVLVLNSQYNALSDDYEFYSYSHFFWEYRAPFHFAFLGLLTGLVLAVLHVRGNTPLWIKKKGNIIFIFSLSLLIFLLSNQSYASDGANWIFVIFVIALSTILYAQLMIGAIYSTNVVNAVLSSKICHFISSISYPLYAIHMLVIPFSLKVSNTVVEFSICYILLSLFGAYILHLCIEKPFMRLKKYF